MNPLSTAHEGHHGPAAPQVPLKTMRKAVLAGVVGNYTEQYEFGVYAAVTPVLAKVFFPEGDALVGQLAVFAGLAVGFLIRPLGGFIFGRMGDRMGRKKILSLTIILMGFLTALIGILPTYAAAGFLAPCLLLVLRLGQGLAAGGEYAGAVSFVVEYGPSDQRARYTSFVSISVFAGLLTGTALTFGLTALLGNGAMVDWGWRILFLLALPLTIAGFYLRRAVEDTPEFRRQQEMQERARELSEELPATTIAQTLRTQWKPILVFSGFAMTNAVLSYTWTAYIPAYLQSTAGPGRPLSLDLSVLSTSIALLVLLPLLYLSGRLSDRIGRKKMLLAGCTTPLVIVPLAFHMVSARTFESAVLAQLVYLVPIFFIAVSVTVCLAEMFPTKMRYTAGSIAFNLAFCIFAGTAPFIASALVDATGTIMSVAVYVCVVSFVSLLVVAFCFKETYRKDLAHDDYNPELNRLVNEPVAETGRA
ncbi:MFS transporter [Streptomyces sp. TP-A0875]|uniref:MFS transporter n=1 Tax=Streptomyces sp. TP-A0875 TaxID=552354 RepID=UPI000A92BCFA|nr:MFS transporter [Streptomyces sp. TP-A0875]